MGDELYLGDGLYASFDGNSIKLRAPREGGDHIVYLEADLYQALADYASRCWRIDDRSRFPSYDDAPTDPHHGGKIWDEPRIVSHQNNPLSDILRDALAKNGKLRPEP